MSDSSRDKFFKALREVEDEEKKKEIVESTKPVEESSSLVEQSSRPVKESSKERPMKITELCKVDKSREKKILEIGFSIHKECEYISEEITKLLDHKDLRENERVALAIVLGRKIEENNAKSMLEALMKKMLGD